MNGVFSSVAGDLFKETNQFALARASVYHVETTHEDDLQELQDAALERDEREKQKFVSITERTSSGGVAITDHKGNRTLVRPSLMHRQSVRTSLLHAVSRKGREMGEEEDETAALMQQVRARFDAAGVPIQDVLIRFRNLSVTGRAAVKSGPPTPVTQLRGALQRVKTKGSGRSRKVHILDKVSSVLKPGRFTLLLGPPGSGKTTLMRALSGMLKSETKLKVTADELTYNGLNFNQFVVERTADYVNQLDIHFGELTVRETLDFAALCQTSRSRKPAEVLLEEREKELGIEPDPAVAAYMKALGEHHRLATDIAIKALGLDGCANTLVGNAMIRGVSGGQKKRVTTGEMLVGPSNVLFADEISTGLDSATTYEICSRLRALCHTISGTVLVSLLQPTPETFGVFDDIMLLSGGRLVFHGPRECVQPFFEGLGFVCPPSKGVADFLQDVTLHQEQPFYWSGAKGEWQYLSPKAVEEAYRGTDYGAAFVAELDMPAAEEKEGHGELALHKYAQGSWTLFKANLARQKKLFLRNRAFIVIRFAQCIFMGFAVGTLFLQQSRDTLQDAQMFMSVSFFSIMTQLVVSFAAPGLLIERLPVYYRQRDHHFYPAWCFALPELLLQVPLIASEATIWTAMIYFMVGFSTSARVLVFWGIMFVAGINGLSLFMLLALFAKTITIAAALQNLFILIATIASGFIVSPANLSGGWLGAYYANPVSYFLQALVVNEFESPNWGGPAPDGQPGQTAGNFYLQERGYFPGQHWIWIGLFAWGLGSTLLNTGLFMVAASYLTMNTGVEAVEKPDEGLEDLSVRSLARASLNRASLTRASAQRVGSAKGTTEGDVEEGGSGSGAGQGGSLPFTPVRMTFGNVKYSVPLPKGRGGAQGDGDASDPHNGRLLLLKGITGSFRPGVLTALMGSSGAGKTTLMDVLALRKTSGLVTGDIRVNGYPQRAETFMRIAGYCEQTDIHMPEATVHEALLFSARLRLPASVPSATAEAFVEEMMETVELGDLRGATIGMPGQSGLSVEQRKRLTIAVELCANPSIIFLDEPTSGLDARAAAIVMRAVRRIADRGRTLVATIHQPSADIFSAFDELLLLKRGGQTIFHGSLGPGAKNLVAYFEELKGVEAFEPGQNPATWMLDVSAPSVEADTGLDFADHYALSPLADANEAAVAAAAQPHEGEADLRLADLRAASQLTQTRELLRRNLQQYWRLTSYNGTRMLITCVIAFFFGTVLKGQGDETYTYNGIMNLTGVQYSSIMFIGILNAMAIQSLISLRRTVFYREQAGGTYATLPYSIAEFAVEVPYLVLQATLYSCIVYWLVGFQPDAGKFFMFLGTFILTLMYWTFFGIQNVHITPTLQIANAFTSFMFGVWDLFCGYYKPKPIIPAGWKWMWYIDPVSWTLYALIAGELGDVDSPMLDQPLGEQVSVREFISSYFSYDYEFIGYTALILAAFSVLFFALSTSALRYIKWHSR